MISGAVGPGDHEAETSSIWLVSILGGEPRKLRSGAFRATISPDDSLVAYMGEDGIWLADADGDNPRNFIEAEGWEAVGSPGWSPDGKRVVYRRVYEDKGVLVATIESRGLDETDSAVLVRQDNLTNRGYEDIIWGKDFLMLEDRLVYALAERSPRSRDDNLWEIAIDPRSGTPAGEPRRLTDWVGLTIGGLSATADGSRVVFSNDRGQTDVWVGELVDEGRRLESARRLTLDDRDDYPSCWTPDGRTVVFESDRNGSQDLLAQDVDEKNARDLVVGPGNQSEPRLTPDGTAFLYWEEATSESAGSWRLLRIPVGGGPTELVLEVQGWSGFDCATTPDGPCVLVELRTDENIATLSRLDPVKGRGEQLWRDDVTPEFRPNLALSPDGSQLAWVGHSEDPTSIRIQRVDGAVRDIHVDGLPDVTFHEVEWSPDGDGFYLLGETPRGVVLLRVDLQGEAHELYEAPTADFSGVKPSPDGRYLAFGQSTWDTNVWMIENF